MKILGISALDKDSTATLVEDGKITAAISEERITRVKQQAWFPFRSLEKILADFGLSPSDIDKVAFSFLPADIEWQLRKKCYKNSVKFALKYFSLGSLLHILNFSRIMLKWTMHEKQHLSLIKGLQYYGLLDKLCYINHHQAHAASAYFTSGFDECLVVSIDALGSGASGGVYLAAPETGPKLVYEISFPNSLAIFYQRLTAALGFRPDRHEGKVLGLAAFGNSSVDCYKKVKERFVTKPGKILFKDPMNPFFELWVARKYKREDCAAVYQRVLEEIVCGFVDYYVKKYQQTRVALAGGLFANVKANQRIAELPGVKEIFIHPGMGDVGVGTGAALQVAFESQKIRPHYLEDVYLGPSYSDVEIKKELQKFSFKFSHYKGIEKKIADLLAEGKIVGYFDGKMEYGPRALGNRSILVQATDASINNSLNKKLRRTEFMPFAPVVLMEDAEKCFVNVDKARHAAIFMTITFDCTDFMKEKMPAAVHIDGTARPQLITREINPSYYDIVNEYKKITGIPGIINTSFNIHEEPIVCSPEDAIRGFLEAELDYLAMGNYLVSYEDNKKN